MNGGRTIWKTALSISGIDGAADSYVYITKGFWIQNIRKSRYSPSSVCPHVAATGPAFSCHLASIIMTDQSYGAFSFAVLFNVL